MHTLILCMSCLGLGAAFAVLLGFLEFITTRFQKQERRKEWRKWSYDKRIVGRIGR